MAASTKAPLASNDFGQSLQPLQESAKDVGKTETAKERLAKYNTGMGLPWHVVPNWTQEDLQERLLQEMQAARRLFAATSTDIPIGRSPFAVNEARITFKDVSFSLPKSPELPQGKCVLEPVSGHYEPGQLVAIMGPSGCGKSTLLDMLAMKKTARYEGQILINGHERDHLFTRIASYVGQADVMPQFWKVREAIEFNLALKRISTQKVQPIIREQIVSVLLDCFGLGGVANTYIGGDAIRGISGGQRRRVTLARGVAAQASVLFCDEPTSGLSSTDAELCIRALRVIAKRMGTLVFVVIHQPRIEVQRLFDEVIILTANPGRMLYSGAMSRLAGYMEDVGFKMPEYANPADFVLDMATPSTAETPNEKDKVAELVAAFKSRQQPLLDEAVQRQIRELAEARLEHVEDFTQLSNVRGLSARQMLELQYAMARDAQAAPSLRANSRYPVPHWMQFLVLLRRKMTLTGRNRAALLTPVLVPTCQGVLMGLCFQGIGDCVPCTVANLKDCQPCLSRQMPFVFLQLTTLCLSSINLIPTMIEERGFMKYDTMESLYSESAFIMTSFCVDIPLSVLGTTCNMLIMYTFSGMSWDYFPLVYGWGILVYFVFNSLFAFVSACAKNAQMAQISSLPFISIFMLFSGFMVSKASAPVYLRWIFDISPNAYAMQAILNRMIPDFGIEGQMVKRNFGFEDGQDAQGLVILLCSIVVLRLAQVWALRNFNNIQK